MSQDEPRDPRGRAYHALRAPGRWHPLVELVVFAFLTLLLAGVVVGAGSEVAGLAGVRSTGVGLADPLWDLALALASIGVLIAAVTLTVRWAGPRALGTVSSVAGRLRWRWLGTCVAAAVVLVVLQLGVVLLGALLLEGEWRDPARWPGWGTYASVVAVVVLLVPFQAAAEEYMARGWLVQTLAPLTGARWVAAVLSSAGFVALHLPADLWTIADLAVFALAMCWLTFRTGGLEAAIALHAVGNVLSILAEGIEGVPRVDVAEPATAPVALAGVAITLLYAAWVARRFLRLPAPAEGRHHPFR